MTKKFYQSKILWFTLLFALIQVAGIWGFADFTPSSDVVEYVNLGAAVIMAVLRAITNQGIKL